MKRLTTSSRALACTLLLAAAPALFAQDLGRALGGLLKGIGGGSGGGGGNIGIGNLAPASGGGATTGWDAMAVLLLVGSRWALLRRTRRPPRA